MASQGRHGISNDWQLYNLFNSLVSSIAKKTLELSLSYPTYPKDRGEASRQINGVGAITWTQNALVNGRLPIV